MFNLNYIDEQLQIARECSKTSKLTSAALFIIFTLTLFIMVQTTRFGFDARIILAPIALITLYVAAWRNVMIIDANRGVIEIRRGLFYPTFVKIHRLCDFDRLVIRYHVFKSNGSINDLLNPNKHYYLCLVGHEKEFVEIDYFNDMRIAQLRARKIANFAGLIYDHKAYPIDDKK